MTDFHDIIILCDQSRTHEIAELALLLTNKSHLLPFFDKGIHCKSVKLHKSINI